MRQLIIVLSLMIVSALSADQNSTVSNTTQTIADEYYYKGKLIQLTRAVEINGTTLENNETNTTTYHPKTLTYIDENNNSLTISNRLIVKFKKRPDIKKIESDYNITAVKKMRKIYVFEVPDITEVLKTARLIYENEKVKYAQPSFVKKVKNSALIVKNVENHHIKMHNKIMLSNEEDTKSMTDEEGSVNYYKYYDDVFRYDDESYWQIHNKGGFSATAYAEGIFTDIISVADVDSNVIEAIDEGYTGKNVKVAVIDSAFSLNHPDLRFSDSFNIFTQNKDISPDTTADFHGTAVAGVIAANRNNNYGIMGIAPDAYLIGLNGLFEIEDTEYFSESYIDMFYDALDKGADIINCSWGTIDVLDEAIEDVLSEVAEEGRGGKGTFIIFSTGNEGSLKLGKEAALPFVISVGAIESNGKRAGYSTYGKKLDFVAPSNFVSLDLVGKDGFEEAEKGFVAGTSFSAPVVAGCIALILEANPDLTRGQVLDILYATAKKVGTGKYKDDTFSYEYAYNVDESDPYNKKYTKNVETGYGLIDVQAAIKKAKTFIKPKESTTVYTLDKAKITALKPGWNLLASMEPITDFSIFDGTEIVWTNIAGAWKGYSPNGAYKDELEEKGVLLEKIESNSAMWIYK